MKAIELQKSFGLENLIVTEREAGKPKAGEILLRMKSASLNYRDLMMVRGVYNPKQPLPIIPGSDGVGEVIEIGEGVTKVKKGERVATTFFQDWESGLAHPDKAKSTLGSPLDGVLREFMVLPEKGVISVPKHLTDEQAATLPCAGLTAWNAVVQMGRVKPGSTVLIQGTGGVALFALQFAKMLGAQVILTSSSEEKLARAKTLGADHGIDYKKNPQWGKEVRNITSGEGVDLVVELGGAGTLGQSLAAVKLGGAVALIGVLTGGNQDLSILPIIMKNVLVQGIFVGTKEQFACMNEAISFHKLTPVVSQIFPLAESRKAFECMASGSHFGKIGIQISA